MVKVVVRAALLTSLYFCGACFAFEAELPLSDDTVSSVDNRTVFPVTFFSQYSPQNALDMVERLPGFTFNQGSDDRGFGGNAGNVLINGTRPTSKSSGLEGALERIPVSQVLHIEILRGGVNASDSAGQSVIANVIKKEAQTSGTWSFLTMRTKDGTFKPQLEGTVSTKLGDWETSFNGEVGGVPGYRTAQLEKLDAEDAVTAYGSETLEELEEYIEITGEASRQLNSGKLTVNASISGVKEQNDIQRDIYLVSNTIGSAPNEFEEIGDEEEQTAYELSVDWHTSNNTRKLHMIALASRQNTDYISDYVSLDQNLNINESKQYQQDTTETEYIFRTSYALLTESMLKPEFGFEIAKNELESDSAYIKNGAPQELEGVNSVEELRGEFFANFIFEYSPTINIEGGVTTEFSKIEAHSDTTNSQTFNFIKPRLALNYKINEDSTLIFEVLHEVEQLDFNDFAASSDTSDDITTSGNNNLEPEQTTQFSIFYDLYFSDRGSFDIKYYYEDRQDVHEDIFLPSGNAGLGNAGDASFWGIQTNVNLPLDYVIKGGLLEVEYLYENSDFDDPIINHSRSLNYHLPHYLELNFRQDITAYQMSWGIEYVSDYQETTYYVDEKQTEGTNHRLASMFIETTRFYDTKMKLKIKDVNTSRYKRSRYFYEDGRSGAYLGSEVANRKRELQVLFTLSSTF